MKNTCILAFAMLAFTASSHGEIYKWTDADGKVHYSDQAPDKAPREVPRSLALDNVSVSAEDRRVAQERASKEKALAEKVAPAQRSASAAPTSRTTPPATSAASNCKEQWALYEKSRACFSAYRLENGRVKGEAHQHCATVAMPACALPSR